MSLKDFQTYLRPETKNAKLGFYQKPTAAFPNGRVLEADFSRPDTDATSGATVYDKDRNLVELTENQPDWSFPLDGGCPRLIMRPQATNYANDPIDFASWTSGGDAIITKNAALDIFGNMDAAQVVTAANAFSGIRGGVTNIPTAGVNITISCWLKGEVGGELVRLAAASGSGTIESGNFTLTNEWQKYTFTRVAPDTSIFPQTINTLAAPSVKTYYISAFQISYIDTDFIPGHELTRSANSFDFTDLITKGVIGAGGAFSFILNCLWKDTGSDVDVLNFQTAASTDQIVLRAKTGGNLVWAYEGGSGLVELGTGLAVDTAGKIGLSYDGTNILLSVDGSSDTSATASLSAITKLVCAPNNRYLEIRQDSVLTAFSPIALSQTELNASTL